ncbi:hypothetical protein DFJ63DRAFT_34582 [Scheffersomyces coipomensis]|uniref:uncharacterized protein n=1 Tax=Scheffersomyces coipomensis TaxID=1788519 RepID=UPI00315D9543
MARQNFVGLVVSQGKMAKTVKVRVQGKVYDTKIHKEVIKRKDYLVHDEGELCKEGDIVRIESIPKVSKRKAFAIAEIKVNQGQQFALYEKLAKQKVSQDEKLKQQETIQNKSNLEATTNRINDLRKLDDFANIYQTSNVSDEEKAKLLADINAIKEKYNIKSWPSNEALLNLKINESEVEHQGLEVKIVELQKRRLNLDAILEKFLSDELVETRNSVLSSLTKSSTDQLKKYTVKNLLRKYVLNVENEIPFSY